MRKNLGISRGLIVAEAVMMALAPYTGRQQAHDLVYAACRVVNEQGGTLADTIADVPEVTRHFDRAEINRLTDPANYLGSAPQMGRPRAGLVTARPVTPQPDDRMRRAAVQIGPEGHRCRISPACLNPTAPGSF
jgi:hypothetical protein